MSEITMFSRDEGYRILAEARRLRSDQFAAGVLWIGRNVINLVRVVGTAFAEARRQQAVYESLSQLTDRQLRDIGLTRTDIPAVAAGILTREIRMAPTVAVAGAADQSLAASPTRRSEPDRRPDQRIAA